MSWLCLNNSKHSITTFIKIYKLHMPLMYKKIYKKIYNKRTTQTISNEGSVILGLNCPLIIGGVGFEPTRPLKSFLNIMIGYKWPYVVSIQSSDICLSQLWTSPIVMIFCIIIALNINTVGLCMYYLVVYHIVALGSMSTR